MFDSGPDIKDTWPGFFDLMPAVKDTTPRSFDSLLNSLDSLLGIVSVEPDLLIHGSTCYLPRRTILKSGGESQYRAPFRLVTAHTVTHNVPKVHLLKRVIEPFKTFGTFFIQTQTRREPAGNLRINLSQRE